MGLALASMALLTPVAAQPVPSSSPLESAGGGWTAQVSGTPAKLSAVSFSDPVHGHAVGEGGTILGTSDGGKTWRAEVACTTSQSCRASSPDRISGDLNGVSVPERSTGYVVGAGGTILATTDGGRRWVPQFACAGTSPCLASSPDRVTADLNGVSFADPSAGYAVGAGGTILATADGGRRWTPQSACQDRPLSGPVARARIDVSCTGESPDRIIADLRAVDSPMPSHAVAVGSAGFITRTENAGRAWHAVCAQPPCGGGSGVQIRDGEAVWVSEPRTHGGITADLTDVSFADTRTGRVVGAGGTILNTSDGGRQWKSEHACRNGGACAAAATDRVSADLLGVSHPDPGHARVVGRSGSAMRARPPSPWVSDMSGTTLDLEAISFPDANAGYAVGAQGAILKHDVPPPGPLVDSVSPSRGSTAGGTEVTITGSGLAGATHVNFAGVPAPDVQVRSDTQLTATSPILAPGTFAVTATTAGGGSAAHDGALFTSVAPAGGSWEPTSPCQTACAGRAVLLPDGRVLLAGSTALNSVPPETAAEVYDPSSGSWSPTATMLEARAGHSTTALHDGRVLVAGGRGPNPTPGSELEIETDLATAALYEPATSSWRRTAPMPTPRSDHTATVLGDGRVLVAGGQPSRAQLAENARAGRPFYVSDALVYDPTTETWAPAGTMVVPRILHAATRLEDGRVLVAGGSEGGGPSSAPAELYDPVVNNWTQATPLGVARNLPTTTLLDDGRVLVVGGADGQSKGLPFAELFDPHSGSWSPTAPLAVGRWKHTATGLPDGRVLVVGGSASTEVPVLPFVELYDPGQGRWQLVRSLPLGRQAHTAMLVDRTPCGDVCGKVLVVAGSDCHDCQLPATSAHLYSAPPLRRGSAAEGATWGPLVVAFVVALVVSGLAVVGLGTRLALRRRVR